MNPHDEIVHAVEQLLRLIKPCSTETVVGWCYSFQLKRATEQTTDTALWSPAKQISFLIGLLLSTPPPDTPKNLDEKGWSEAIKILNKAFSEYQVLFWPSPEELGSLSDEWHRTRDVAMPTFLHYFNTGLLATIEQVRQRTLTYLAPFDKLLSREIGISASGSINVADYIKRKQAEILDNLVAVAEDEKEQRLTFLSQAKEENWPLEKMREKVQASEYPEVARNYFDLINQLSHVRFEDIIQQFPRTGEAFWELFTVARGTVSIMYPTDRSIFEERPLILLNEQECMCPSINALYNAILLVNEEFLQSSNIRDNYLNHRDKELEQEIKSALDQFYGTEADYYANVYETSDQQYEHDLIIRCGRTLIVVELKATPLKAPFRDPDKAFIRIHRAFKSDTGIQKAYNQGMRAWRKWNDGEAIDLFDEQGKLIVTLPAGEIDQVYCLCATRDDFGPIAINLSLLLEKDSSEPYPWVVNVFDLRSLVEAWEYFDWDVNRFHEFLEQRIQLHGKVFATDELELVGFFIEHGSLDYLLKLKADLIPLDSNYSNVFDKLYQHLYLDGPPVEYDPTEPFIWDLRASLAADEVVEVKLDSQQHRKQGRNEPCACGSGKKYKRCCGR